MRRLRYTASARADLGAIAFYIARESGSRAVADEFERDLRAYCRKLATLPGTLGIARPELAPDIRSIPFCGYLIFFRYRDDALEIVNLLEGHRDIDAHFSGQRGTAGEDSILG